MSHQLTINFDQGLADSYPSCREYIQARVHQLPKPQALIAAAMDLSPSDLSRKCAQAPNDTRRFTLDELETFVDVTGDTKPILYLVEKFLAKKNPEDIQKEIDRLTLLKQQAENK